MGPIEATPLNVNTVACEEKALLSVKIAPSSRGCQKTVTCKIDSGTETNIVPRSLYNQICPETTVLEKPTVKLSAYGGTEIPNLGSCKMYVQGPHNCEPKQITFEVVDVPGPVIIGNTTARELNLLKLNWPVAAIPKSSSEKKTSIPTNEGVFTQRIQRCVYRDWFVSRPTLPHRGRREYASSAAPTKTSARPPTTCIQEGTGKINRSRNHH